MALKREIDHRLLEPLKLLAPGTIHREGIDNILNAGTGALIIFGDEKDVLDITDGGFKIDTEFSPTHLYELAKMDGAVLLSSDGKKILKANTQLNPDPSIETMETGTRHRTAERVAKQTGHLVVSISQRRDVITIYKGTLKYVFREINVLLTKANQAIQTLEKYRKSFDDAVSVLTTLEIDDLVTLNDVCICMMRAEILLRVTAEIERYITELGREGRLVAMQMEELSGPVDGELQNIIEDYKKEDRERDDIYLSLWKLSSDALLDPMNMAKALGYVTNADLLDTPVFTKGFRVLSKIPRLPAAVINNIILHFDDFQDILVATNDELDEVEGVGMVRARNIREGLRRISERSLIDASR
ncbi:DNA integrity scanning diadenylate cyclase DisA [Fusibacter sp. JL216-2]|uniref:DNA integrity scanning diadenylate cyclase DisA n=1 Tax=Fusibacter sp. JL216-2 TaxID=3071453 RepID=UPI003D34DF59